MKTPSRLSNLLRSVSLKIVLSLQLARWNIRTVMCIYMKRDQNLRAIFMRVYIRRRSTHTRALKDQVALYDALLKKNNNKKKDPVGVFREYGAAKGFC